MRTNPTTVIALGAALICVLFVGATIAIISTIRAEAEQTRQAMQQSAESLATDGVRDVMDSALNPDEVEIDHAVQRMEDAAFRLLDGISGERSEGDRSSSQQSSSGRNSADEEKESSLIDAMFRTGHALTKDLDRIGQDLLQLDVAEETQIGGILHERLKDEVTLVNDPRLTAKLKTLATPFLKARTRPEIQYAFFVIENDTVNAFSHLGGYVYVHTGLLDFVKSDAELQFVLGHEIAHIDRRDCAEQTTYAARASEAAGELGGSMVQIAYHAIALGYSEEKELEADAWSYRHMDQPQTQVFAFLDRLESTDKTQTPQDAPQSSPTGSAMEAILGHFRSHPPTSDRKKRLETLN